MSVNPKQSDRRRFLRDGAALAGLAVGVMRPSPWLGVLNATEWAFFPYQ